MRNPNNMRLVLTMALYPGTLDARLTEVQTRYNERRSWPKLANVLYGAVVPLGIIWL